MVVWRRRLCGARQEARCPRIAPLQPVCPGRAGPLPLEPLGTLGCGWHSQVPPFLTWERRMAFVEHMSEIWSEAQGPWAEGMPTWTVGCCAPGTRFVSPRASRRTGIMLSVPRSVAAEGPRHPLGSLGPLFSPSRSTESRRRQERPRQWGPVKVGGARMSGD